MSDIGMMRGVVTLFVMLAFIGMAFWAYSSRRKADFDEMANLPFHEDPSETEQGSKTP
jgi:cytochrome c oxidase cbb3-type subunit IV